MTNKVNKNDKAAMIKIKFLVIPFISDPTDLKLEMILITSDLVAIS